MTIDDIKESIRAYGYGTDTDSALVQAIEAADRLIQGFRRWPWNEATQSLGDLTAGNSSIEFQDPAAQGNRLIRQLDAVYLRIDGGENVPLEFIEYNELREKLELDGLGTTDPVRGEPRYWSVRGYTVFFWPIADRTYEVTVNVTHTSDIAGLDEQIGTYVPRTPPDYHDLYVFYGVRALAARERDWSMYSVMGQNFDNLMRQMVTAEAIRQRQNARRVVDSGFYDGY